MKLQGLEKNIGYNFKNKKLLTTALCHKSYINESKGSDAKSYERLEFLGDSVLGVIVSRYIFENYSTFPEGKLSRLRASVVCEDTLSEVARGLDVGKYIILSNGERSNGGSDKPAILCDVIEAIIAAIFLDADMETAEDFVLKILKGSIDAHAQMHGDNTDYKTLLQEKVQSSGGTVTYEILSESGPDHCKSYIAGVYINGSLVAKGEGTSKKKAQSRAAGIALNEK